MFVKLSDIWNFCIAVFRNCMLNDCKIKIVLSCVVSSLHCSQLWLWSHYLLLYCSEPQSYYTIQLLFWLWFSFTLVQISIQQQHCHKYVLHSISHEPIMEFLKIVWITNFLNSCKCSLSTWKVCLTIVSNYHICF